MFFPLEPSPGTGPAVSAGIVEHPVDASGGVVWVDWAVEVVSPPAGDVGAVSGKVVALTGTIQYDLWKNVLSRLEVRWDKQVGSGKMVGYGGDTRHDDNDTSGGSGVREYVTVALNLIYKF